jgi:hypothetical protein
LRAPKHEAPRGQCSHSTPGHPRVAKLPTAHKQSSSEDERRLGARVRVGHDKQLARPRASLKAPNESHPTSDRLASHCAPALFPLGERERERERETEAAGEAMGGGSGWHHLSARAFCASAAAIALAVGPWAATSAARRTGEVAVFARVACKTCCCPTYCLEASCSSGRHPRTSAKM